MAIDTSRARARAQEELSELQSDHARRKKKVLQQHEEELDSLQEGYAKQKQSLSEQNEAAINHIQKKNDETIEQFAARREAAASRGNEQVSKMEEAYRSRVDKMHKDRTEKLESMNNEQRGKLEKIQSQNQTKIDETHVEGKTKLANLKDQYRKQIQHENQISETKLNSVRQGNETQLQNEKTRGEVQQTRLRENYQNEVRELRQEGDFAVAHESDSTKQKLEKVNEEFKNQYDKNYKSWTAREKNLQEGYSRKLEQQKKAHEDQTHLQEKHFQKVYEKNDKDNKLSLEIQNSMYTKQVLNQKRKLAIEASKYANREEDPFYKVQDRGTKLEETSDSYILTAYVPEHEKDKVKVLVDQSKAVVSGQRSFNDKIEEDNRKVSTNSYQSFREEFTFSKPVASQAMVRQREGDFVIFEIPKLTSVEDRGIKLNKKG